MGRSRVTADGIKAKHEKNMICLKCNKEKKSRSKTATSGLQLLKSGGRYVAKGKCTGCGSNKQ